MSWPNNRSKRRRDPETLKGEMDETEEKTREEQIREDLIELLRRHEALRTLESQYFTIEEKVGYILTLSSLDVLHNPVDRRWSEREKVVILRELVKERVNELQKAA